MKRGLFSILMVLGILYTPIQTWAQSVGVSNTAITPDASSIFEVRATNKGMLIPRVALTATNAAGPIASPATTLLVYNTATAGSGTATGVYPGYYYNAGTTVAPNWKRLAEGTGSGDAWLTTGNFGTTPANNWLGTNDAQDFVFRSNNTERMRILSTGYVVVNDVAPANDAVLSAYGNYGGVDGQGLNFGVLGVSDTTGVYGIGDYRGVLGLSADGDGGQFYAIEVDADNVGVYGDCDVSDYYGWGGYFTGGYMGAYGTVAPTGADTYFGVRGDASGGTGTNFGVAGVSDWIGVYGQGFLGVQGIGDIGVYGSSNNASYFGVWGLNSDALGTGVVGAGNGATSNYLTNGSGGAFTGNDGVYGKAVSTTGTGVIGLGNNSTTANTLTGGSGGAFTGEDGVYGNAENTSGTGVIGVGNNGASVYTNATGSGGAFAGTNLGVYGISTIVRAFGGYFTNSSGSGYAYVGGQQGGTAYKINGVGTVATIVERPDGTRANMFCPEAPEILFQDYGTGQLSNGKAHIELDPILTKNIYVDDEHPMKVFIQLEGDCNGVYVTNKTATGFEVVELQAGSSNVPFSWSIVANRIDRTDNNGNIISKHVGVRFPDGPAPLDIKTEEPNKMKSMELKEGIQFERRPDVIENAPGKKVELERPEENNANVKISR